MEKLVVHGGTPLKGEVNISGAKNAAVAILPASLLVNGVCTISNLPNIADVKISCEILESLGAKVTWIDKNTITVDSTNISSTIAPLDLTTKFRASYYLIGSMLRKM
jgi:UDP-N-acetylglucosamine 1-carboxyvinyltransferase